MQSGEPLFVQSDYFRSPAASRALLAQIDFVFSQPLALSLPGPPMHRSLPFLPLSLSLPGPPLSVSLPFWPLRKSLPLPPLSLSLPAPPQITSLPPSPESVSFPPRPAITSRPCEPVRTSLPFVPTIVVARPLQLACAWVPGPVAGGIPGGLPGGLPGPQLERSLSWVSSPRPSLSQSLSSRAERSRWTPVSVVIGDPIPFGGMSPFTKTSASPPGRARRTCRRKRCRTR